ncbi:MAG TPA: hypothetical protein HPP76_02360 [Desulfuromonadales bacterium]|nr:hypothetical protein [Desulfuromonadales bacterium]
MSNTTAQRPHSVEEIRLRRKYLELARIREELKTREQSFHALSSEIRMFEREYQDILGNRIEVLRDIEWQLEGFLGGCLSRPRAVPEYQDTPSAGIRHTTSLLDDVTEQGESPGFTIRALFRNVAKAFHPDYAADDNDQRRRQELMIIANEAYKSGNHHLLATLLSERDRKHDSATTGNLRMELMLINRQITAASQAIINYDSMMTDLKLTEIFLFKQRVDRAMVDGIDLLSEMAARVDADIERARRQLARLHRDALAPPPLFRKNCLPSTSAKVHTQPDFPPAHGLTDC